MWINNCDDKNFKIGDMGFLSVHSRQQRADFYRLRQRPPHTNRSGEPRPNGWCGETNNVSVTGIGVWRVVRIAKNGRIQIQKIKAREEIVSFLDTVGYPELLEECMDLHD